MSRRNMVWLAAVVAAGVVAGIASGWLAGVLAALGVLVLSEIVERARRRRLHRERGTEVPSVRDAVKRRR